MAEQKDTNSKGAPMSNGIGGTVESGSGNTGSGGGSGANRSFTSGSNPGTGNSGSSSTGSNTSSSGSNDSGNSSSVLSDLKESIDQLLPQFPGVPSYEDVVAIFVAAKFGLDKAKEEIESMDASTQEAKEDKEAALKDLEEETKEITEYYTNGDGKKALQNTYNKMKTKFSFASESIKKLPSAIVSAIAAVALPSSVGAAIPNYPKYLVQLNTEKNAILNAIDAVVVNLSDALGLADELGLSEMPAIQQVGNIIGPLTSAKSKMASQKSAESAETAENAGKWSERLGIDEIEGVPLTQLEQTARDLGVELPLSTAGYQIVVGEIAKITGTDAIKNAIGINAVRTFVRTLRGTNEPNSKVVELTALLEYSQLIKDWTKANQRDRGDRGTGSFNGSYGSGGPSG